MKNMISKLLTAYETGKMSRRDLVQGLAVLAAAPATASAAGFQGSSINHIGVDKFQKDSVAADLKVRGANPIDQQGGDFGFHVLDPDGFPVQISANNPA
jgi:hypothetical protein